jgi:Transglycosylase-like domain
MTFRHAVAGALSLSAVAGATATPSLAQPRSEGTVPAVLAHRYDQAYRDVHRLGGAPGRDIVDDGLRQRGDERPATANDVRHALPRLHRMRRTLTGGGGTPGATTSTTTSSLPSCTWAPESGGDYGAVNAGSGARGKYQIVPETYAAYGGDGSWSPADQERVAGRIYAATGGSAWANC